LERVMVRVGVGVGREDSWAGEKERGGQVG
jgi:hypothetical protein